MKNLFSLQQITSEAFFCHLRNYRGTEDDNRDTREHKIIRWFLFPSRRRAPIWSFYAKLTASAHGVTCTRYHAHCNKQHTYWWRPADIFIFHIEHCPFLPTGRSECLNICGEPPTKTNEDTYSLWSRRKVALAILLTSTRPELRGVGAHHWDDIPTIRPIFHPTYPQYHSQSRNERVRRFLGSTVAHRAMIANSYDAFCLRGRSEWLGRPFFCRFLHYSQASRFRARSLWLITVIILFTMY